MTRSPPAGATSCTGWPCACASGRTSLTERTWRRLRLSWGRASGACAQHNDQCGRESHMPPASAATRVRQLGHGRGYDKALLRAMIPHVFHGQEGKAQGSRGTARSMSLCEVCIEGPHTCVMATSVVACTSCGVPCGSGASYPFSSPRRSLVSAQCLSIPTPGAFAHITGR